MSDKIQIKKEIERLKQTNGFLPIDNYDLCDAYRARGYQLACDDILQFIDSLPEEHSSEDLEEAAEKYAYEEFPSIGITNTVIELAFKNGAKWQRKKDVEKMMKNIS